MTISSRSAKAFANAIVTVALLALCGWVLACVAWVALGSPALAQSKPRRPDDGTRIDIHPIMLDACGQQLIDAQGHKRRVKPCVRRNGVWVIPGRARRR